MKTKMKIASGMLACSLVLSAASCGGKDAGDPSIPGYDESKRVVDTRDITDREYTSLNIVGTDDYGRKIVTVDGKNDEDAYVGMFFFLSLGQHSNHRGEYDISKITQDGTDLEAFQGNTRESPLGAAHFWGEPVFGYYNSSDEWVIRKQIEMLTLAGIDFIVLDTSNAVTYKSVTDVLFPVMLEYYNKGWNVPKVMYYIANNDGKNTVYPNTLREVYNYFYATETYRDLWFCPNGKPMITRHELANDTFLSTFDGGKYLNFFDFRTRQWPISDYNKPDGAAWIEFEYPQPLHTDWLSISVAQHYSVRFSDTIGTHGRGWNEATGKNDHDNYGKGLNYETQWQTAYNYQAAGEKVRFAFITGWNEWVAEKMYDSSTITYFTVDQFNEEYSRDIEPCVNDKVADNFYMQTIRNLRTFNYSDAKHYVYPKLTIDTSKDDSQWNSVRAFVDFTDDCKDRNARGMVGSRLYTDTSGRNDIETVKVARDDTYMYFRVTTAENVTSYQSGDDKWMNILINTDNARNKWKGYNYVINRSVDGNKTAIMKADGKGSLTKKADGEVYVYGKTMIVKVKLSDLGLSSTNYHIEFKVADNVADYDHVELYRSGDAAPIGRLNYSYGY